MTAAGAAPGRILRAKVVQSYDPDTLECKLNAALERIAGPVRVVFSSSGGVLPEPADLTVILFYEEVRP